MSRIEQFGKYNNSRYEVNANVVKSLNTSHGTVYGTTEVAKGKYEWVVKWELGNTERCCGLIGITSHHNKQDNWAYDQSSTVALYHRSASSPHRKCVNLSGSCEVSIISQLRV